MFKKYFSLAWFSIVKGWMWNFPTGSAVLTLCPNRWHCLGRFWNLWDCALAEVGHWGWRLMVLTYLSALWSTQMWTHPMQAVSAIDRHILPACCPWHDGLFPVTLCPRTSLSSFTPIVSGILTLGHKSNLSMHLWLCMGVRWGGDRHRETDIRHRNR